MMEEQMHLSVTPRLSLGTSVSNEEFNIGMLNNGIGPAEVVTTEIKIDDEPMPNWQSVFHKLDSTKNYPKGLSTSKLNDILIGEQKYWGIISITDTTWVKVFAKNKSRISIRICYKSLFEDWYEVTRNTMEVKGAVVTKKIEKNTIPPQNGFWRNTE
ncbi:MAG: hypothetical protein ACEPO8_11710, partial [Rhodothermaceae bacterium]